MCACSSMGSVSKDWLAKKYYYFIFILNVYLICCLRRSCCCYCYCYLSLSLLAFDLARICQFTKISRCAINRTRFFVWWRDRAAATISARVRERNAVRWWRQRQSKSVESRNCSTTIWTKFLTVLFVCFFYFLRALCVFAARRRLRQ